MDLVDPACTKRDLEAPLLGGIADACEPCVRCMQSGGDAAVQAMEVADDLRQRSRQSLSDSGQKLTKEVIHKALGVEFELFVRTAIPQFFNLWHYIVPDWRLNGAIYCQIIGLGGKLIWLSTDVVGPTAERRASPRCCTRLLNISRLSLLSGQVWYYMIGRALDLAVVTYLCSSYDELRRHWRAHLVSCFTLALVLFVSLVRWPVASFRRPAIACCVLVEASSLLWMTLETIPGAQVSEA